VNETEIQDNTFTTEVCVTVPSDVDGDFDVDIFDIVRLVSHYGTHQSDPQYCPNCGIDGNRRTDIYDVVIACTHYGQRTQ